MSTAAAKMLAGDREAYGELYQESRPRGRGIVSLSLGIVGRGPWQCSYALLTLNRRGDLCDTCR